MLTQNRRCSAQSLGVLVSVRFLHIFPFHSPFLLWPLRLWRTVFVFLCQALFRLLVDKIIVGVRPSVCGYGKDSAFALRDFGARIFTGEGGLRGLCLSSPWFWCSMLFAECDPFDVQLQHHRFGPRLSWRSSERPVTSTRNWRNCTFLAQISNGAQISRQVVCRVSVGQKSELRAHQMAVPGQRRTENPR